MYYIWSESSSWKMAGKFFIIFLLVIPASACKQEDNITRMAKDWCSCIMPMLENEDKVMELLQRRTPEDDKKAEALIEKGNEDIKPCLAKLEKNHGNMEAYKDQIMEAMTIHCPRAAEAIKATN